MEGPATPREVAVPVEIFGTLRRELGDEAGALVTIHALHRAGYRAGAAAAATLAGAGGNGSDSLAASTFWARLCDFFARRGWGTLSSDVAHRGVGLLTSRDWAEATPHEPDPDGSCCFSSGFLSGLLSEQAGGPIAVLEVECRTRGDGACRFAFGSEAAVHELYGRLLDGADLEGALSAL